MTRAQIQFSYQTEIQFENERGEISSNFCFNFQQRGKGERKNREQKWIEN